MPVSAGLDSGKMRLLEIPMRKNDFKLIAFVVLVQLCVGSASRQARAQAENAEYPAMAPVDAYLIADQNAEIALARSAAPASIAKEAEVMVLGKSGFTTAVKGTNGFLCLVERSWAVATDDPEFWNPKIRSPNCFNAAAAGTFAQIFLMKTRLVLEGKSKTEIAAAIASALDKKELPALEPGAMCYMMSKQQYLNDRGKSWHPHVMVFVSGDAAKSWGADKDDSPIMETNDPEERVTIFMFWVGNWSDGSPAPGSPAPSMEH
jgi:hypothetical protein